MRNMKKIREMALLFLAISTLAAAVNGNMENTAIKSESGSSTVKKENGKEVIPSGGNTQNTQVSQGKKVREVVPSNKTSEGYDLNFDISQYAEKSVEVNGKEVKFRAYEDIVYIKNPVEINYQTINIYIPEEYFNGKSAGKYNSRTAPIFFPNSVGGYMPGAAGTPGIGRDGKPNAISVALSKGYVVAAPGARGRTLKNSKGEYTGKAPAVIVDLKAAVRYLKYNDKRIPGRADRIISNGTSAGGALSALLGATGNSRDYEPYLKELGAAQADDNIYAVSAYCPITNLDHGNEAYEWMFNGIDSYQKMSITMLDYNVERKTEEKTLTDAEKSLSPKLKEIFPEYVNSLKLKGKNGKILTLDKEGNGSFKEYLKKYVIASANNALKKGEDLSQFKFLVMKDNKVIDINFEEYARSIGRLKVPGAFDAMDMSSGENNLFGNSKTDNRHFTKFMAEYTKNSEIADAQTVKMMNPMEYIGKKGAMTSKYWRIRHGETDRDTSLAIPAILALKLENSGKTVDFSVPWGQGHGGDYDLEELFSWMDSIVNKK